MADEHENSDEIHLSADISAPASTVWAALTTPRLIAQWMLGGEMEITSDWTVGGPIVFRGDLHGIPFETRGTIQAFEPERVFQYDYWSTLSVSVLPDSPENYSVVRFDPRPTEGGTHLALTLSRFADDSIPRHAKLYWTGTLQVLREFCERRPVS